MNEQKITPKKSEAGIEYIREMRLAGLIKRDIIPADEAVGYEELEKNGSLPDGVYATYENGKRSYCRVESTVPDMTGEEIDRLIALRKAAKAGCTLSAQDAAFLAERCGCSLTLLQTEVEKLCTYRQSGEITRADISALVPRTLDASAYDLSELLFAGNCGAALRMLDDLFQQRVEPVLILSAVSGAFVDCYRGKLAVRAGKSSQQAAADFGYFGGRAYYFGKACTKARGLSDGYLNACMEVLFRTNRLMNSSKTDSRLLLERAFTEISALKGARV